GAVWHLSQCLSRRGAPCGRSSEAAPRWLLSPRSMESQRGLRAACGTYGAALMLALALGGCGPDQVKSPNPTRSLDERRAIEVIRRAIQNESANPAPGRDIKISNGTTVHIDVGIEGHEYGIAYISIDDAAKLGSSIPPPNKKDERLRLMRGGDDGETRIVLL